MSSYRFSIFVRSMHANIRQLKAIRELRSQVERYERVQNSLLAGTKAFQHEHAKILAACQAGNPRLARSAVVEHIASAKRIVAELAWKTHIALVADSETRASEREHWICIRMVSFKVFIY
jgi:DNA-binding FadR family transcriptional regulator